MEARDLADLLAERQRQSDRVLDGFGVLKESYQDWHDRTIDVLAAAAGDKYVVIWPDKTSTEGQAKIPNFIRLAAEDRSRRVAALPYSLVVPTDGVGEKANDAAQKRERILSGYHSQSRCQSKVAPWAMDAMSAGVTICKVMPDFSKPPSERYPIYSRLSPLLSFPSPVFTEGPFLDDFVYAYEDKRRSVEVKYGVELFVPGPLTFAKRPDRVNVIEFHSKEWTIVAVEAIAKTSTERHPPREIVTAFKHDLGKCPVVIGVRTTMDGTYRSDFHDALGVMNTLNKSLSMELDASIDRVYPERVVDLSAIENDGDWGPDATIRKIGPEPIQNVYGYVQKPSANYSQFQLLNILTEGLRTSVQFSPSTSGDPNESVISAAGINASRAGETENVESIQRDVLAPMLEAANEVAFCWDVKHCEAKDKSITGYHKGEGFTETYTPSKDIGTNYRNRVVYGMGTGLGAINQNVMVIQQQGSGLISKRTAMEQSPFVEDPGKEEKRIAIEHLRDATFAGLVAQAAQGQLNSDQLARIQKAFEDEDMSLQDAIIEFGGPQAPLAPPPGSLPPPAAPGIAGAGEAQQAFNGPPLAEVLP